MADNLQKRPSKGILKNSSSFDKQDTRVAAAAAAPTPRKSLKETKWDEMNIIATLHPADKDYGHMKIAEPKTPYNYDYEYTDSSKLDAVDAAELAERIRLGNDLPPKAMQSSEDEDSDDDLPPEEKAKRKEFANKRKKHYNEFYAVHLARKLLEEEDEEDDETPDDSRKDSCSKILDSNCPPQSCSK